MVSIKFTLKNKPNKDGKHTIILILIKNRKNTSLATSYSCKYEEWSFESNMLKAPKKNKDYEKLNAINNFISKTKDKWEKYILEKRTIDEDFSIQELIAEIKNNENKKTIKNYFSFHQEIIDEMINSNRIGTAVINKDTLNSLKKFYAKKELRFIDLNFEFLQKYESFLRSRGGTESGIAIKMRTIRAIYNTAIKRNYIPERLYPFKIYKISILKNEKMKEYLTENEIKNLVNVDLSLDKKHQFAKEMFLFSFYCRGMNFIDLISLEKQNIFEDKCTYTRNKTGVNIEFKLMNYSQIILNKYKEESLNKYIFPILLSEEKTILQIKNRSHKILGEINNSLKEIMGILNINKHITFYCARHSFATYLKFNNISIDTIGEMLGHKDIISTQSYLNKLPSKHLDQIAEDVLNKLNHYK